MGREPIPPTVTSTDGMLALVARRLDEQSELLAEIRDRLPVPTVAGQPEPEAGQPVQVREPAPPAGEGNAGDRSGGEGGAVQVTEPAPPPRPAKKTAKKASKPAKK